MKKLIVCLSVLWCVDYASAAERYVGYLIAKPESANAALAGGANAVAFGADNVLAINRFLNEICNKAMPLVEGTTLIWNPQSGLYDSPLRSNIKEALKPRNYMVWLDEPFWRVRNACWQGKQLACDDVNAGYPHTKAAMQSLRATLGFKKLVHIESYMELQYQKSEHGYVVNLPAASYVSFDCYGDVNNCGGYSMVEYFTWQQQSKLPGQKMWLTPGTFWHPNFFPTIGDAEAALHSLVWFFNNNPDIAGFGGFLWDTVPGDNPGETYTGAEDLPGIRDIFNSAVR